MPTFDNPLEKLTTAEITSDRYLCRTLIPDEPIVAEIRRRLEQAELMRGLLQHADVRAEIRCRLEQAAINKAEAELYNALEAARDAMAAFKMQAGWVPSQKAYSTKMTQAEFELTRAIQAIDEILAKVRGEQDYVAWLRWSGDEQHRHLTVCDSDARGAFKVYRRS